eukprot:TRINITY_DN32957_c0_g1_i1.p1 TRINITY_DN32957_c0_g1~~TRINITY_DN32957_c0_g1_i1.p1  ORF type:complete len:1084 (+),score=381.26 TRINITY_DN32957_c0_g1_i1:91-3252(+)
MPSSPASPQTATPAAAFGRSFWRSGPSSTSLSGTLPLRYRSPKREQIPPPEGSPRSRFARGLRKGQLVEAVNAFAVPDRGKVLVRQGTKGIVQGQSRDRQHIMVRFEGLRAPVKVAPFDVAARLRWYAGQPVDAARPLRSGPSGEQPALRVRRGARGMVVGMCPADPTKLAVRFAEVHVADGSTATKVLYVRPGEDVSDATAAEERRQQLEEEESGRRIHTRNWRDGYDALVQAEKDEREDLAFALELQVEHLLVELRYEGSAPQTRTGWTQLNESVLRQAERALAAAAPDAVQKVIGRAEQRIARTGGDLEHRYFYALRRLTGLAGDRDVPEAVHWLKECASLGHTNSRNLLGVVLLWCDEGVNGTTEDRTQEGLRLLRSAARAGSVAAHHNIAKFLAQRAAPAPPPREALLRWRHAAGQGHAPSQWRLGQALAAGPAGEASAGAQLLRLAAQQGHAKAQLLLSRQMLAGDELTGTVGGAAQEGMQWLHRAAKQGLPEALHELGIRLIAGAHPTTILLVRSPPSGGLMLGGAEDDREEQHHPSGADDDEWPSWQGRLPERMRAFQGGSERDRTSGMRCLAAAADRGHTPAMNSLGLCLLFGSARDGSGDRNPSQGVQWLRRAADAGDSDAIHNLGCLQFAGYGTPVDARAALHSWLRAADLGCGESRRKVDSLARWLLSEQGNEQLLQRFEEGDPDAVCDLTLRLLAEKGPADQAVEHLADCEPQPVAAADPTAGAKNDVVVCATMLGKEEHYSSRPAFSGGLLATSRGGVVGQALDAQFRLALQLLSGLGLEQDLSTAAQCLWRIADTSCVAHPGAQNALGVCFEHGLGVPRHAKMALHWYRRAASKGIAAAMHNLATMLWVGESGIRQNRREAVRWWQRAGRDGHPQSAFHYALCLLSGEGCKFDRELGLQKLREAAALGVTEAQRHLERALQSATIDRTASARMLKDLARARSQRSLAESTASAGGAALPSFEPLQEPSELPTPYTHPDRDELRVSEAATLTEEELLFSHSLALTALMANQAPAPFEEEEDAEVDRDDTGWFDDGESSS